MFAQPRAVSESSEAHRVVLAVTFAVQDAFAGFWGSLERLAAPGVGRVSCADAATRPMARPTRSIDDVRIDPLAAGLRATCLALVPRLAGQRCVINAPPKGQASRKFREGRLRLPDLNFLTHSSLQHAGDNALQQAQERVGGALPAAVAPPRAQKFRLWFL